MEIMILKGGKAKKKKRHFLLFPPRARLASCKLFWVAGVFSRQEVGYIKKVFTADCSVYLLIGFLHSFPKRFHSGWFFL